MLPIATMGMVQSHGVVDLLYGYGRFDPAAVTVTANTLLIFLVGLTAHAEIAILAPGFYAGQDTRTPVGIVLGGTLPLDRAGRDPRGSAGSVGAGPVGRPGGVVRGAADGGRPRPAVAGSRRGLARPGPAGGARGRRPRRRDHVAGLDERGGLAVGPARLSLLLRLVLATGAGGLVYVAVSRLLRIPELGTITGVVTDLVRRGR